MGRTISRGIMAENFPELWEDTDIYSRKPPKSKQDKKKYTPPPTIGKAWNTEEEK